MTHRAGSAFLLERIDLTPSLAVFRVRPEGGIPPFLAGQWLKLGLPDAGEADGILWRPYSISSPPEEERFLEFYIRRVWKPVPGRFTTAIWQLEPGARLEWSRPTGRFVVEGALPDGSPDRRRLVMLAGGTGLAPFLSQVRHLHALQQSDPERAPSREIVLCHGASYTDELGYRDLFEELERESVEGKLAGWRFRYVPTVSRPEDPRNRSWRGRHGRVETTIQRPAPGERSAVEALVGAELRPDDTQLLICGFAPTIHNVLDSIAPLGFLGPRKRRPDGTFDVLVDSFG